MNAKIAYFDFDGEAKWKDLDLVFATNALHCAKDKIHTLKTIHQMLKPGGRIVLAEGTPYTHGQTPWPLTFLCGLYDGWWDRGGFLPREEWSKLVQQAGFHSAETHAMTTGELDLGGLIVAVK